ncbi:hypothetical protein [Pseudomaricurvus sp.]|uniref:hypothetical protein n=1 Tax=Pseudomaricurvus sp. TaxID=2004510 RepID=UPI003F6D6FD7
MKILTVPRQTPALKRLTWGVLLLVMLGGQSMWSQAQNSKVYYRYLDENGVKVINHQIPPEYAQKGYEVVTSRGEVIKVVPPAPSAKEVTQMELQRQREAELAEWDEELLRRYSTVRDIEAAKHRKLVQVDGSIAILKGNIRNLKAQIADQHAKAAKMERMGRAVPDTMLKTLAALEEELALSEAQIEEREQQYTQIEKKYDRDIERFKVIQK